MDLRQEVEQLAARRGSKVAPHAVATARWMLERATMPSGEPLPEGTVRAHAGGLRIDWSRGDRRVSLIIPGDSQERPTVQHEQAGEGGGESDKRAPPTPALVFWLVWMMQAEA